MQYGPLPPEQMEKDRKKAEKYQKFADAMMLAGMGGMQSGNPYAAIGGLGAMLLSGKIGKNWGM